MATYLLEALYVIVAYNPGHTTRKTISRRFKMQSSTLHALPVHFLIQGQANYTFTSTKEKRRIHDPLNCKSKNLGYLTECKKCGKQYIGETKRHLHQRFG